MHVHHSNIDYIDQAFSTYNVELVHFVDPGLMRRLTFDPTFSKEAAAMKISEQIAWMKSSQVDAILLTCTNYIALLQDELLTTRIPIFKIDEPFFETICKVTEPQTIFFSNPGTVKGTMERLNHYASERKKELNINAIVIEDTFELMMNGQADLYNEKIAEYIKVYGKNSRDVLSVGQLSMYDASKQTQLASLNPLDSLVPPIVEALELKEY